MKKQVKAWIEFAEKDILTVSEIIENPNLTNIVTFHCQQAVDGSMPTIEQANNFFVFAKDVESKKKNELNKK